MFSFLIFLWLAFLFFVCNLFYCRNAKCLCVCLFSLFSCCCSCASPLAPRLFFILDPPTFPPKISIPKPRPQRNADTNDVLSVPGRAQLMRHLLLLLLLLMCMLPLLFVPLLFVPQLPLLQHCHLNDYPYLNLWRHWGQAAKAQKQMQINIMPIQWP